MRSGVEHLIARFLLVLNLAVAILASLWVLLVWAAPEALSSAGPKEAGTLRLVVRGDGGIGLIAFFAGILVIFDVVWLAITLAPKATAGSVVSDTETGRILVSKDAIENGLRLAGEAVAEVSRLRVMVEAPRGRARRVSVRAQFQAREGAKLERVSGDLREALRRRFAELVSMPSSGRLELDLEFGGFSGRSPRPAESTETPAEEAPAPFTGPKYPIEPED